MLRDRKTLLILFGMPVVQILIFGFALTNEVKNARIVIMDQARDPASRQITSMIAASPYFNIDKTVSSPLQMDEAFREGKIRLALIFPANFNAGLLHTNSAAGVLPRLLDMGIEPFLIASTVNTIIGQRLVRQVAKRRETYQSTPIETQNIMATIGHLLPKTKEEVAKVSADLGYKDLPLAGQSAYTLVRGIDTPQTPHGYSGRVGIYEVMDVNADIQKLIVNHATSSEIQRLAVSQGMITMRQDGYLKALTGVTTLEEVNRVTSDTA